MNIIAGISEETTALFSHNDKIVERFCEGNKVFIVSCIGDRTDLSIASYLANVNGNQKMIFVPSEISEESLNEIISKVEGKSLLYSECTNETDFGDVQVLIIDFLGSLPWIYQYCNYAYIGIGDEQYRPTILETITYGIPIAFRSKIYQTKIHSEIIRLGIGTIIRNGKGLDKWFKNIRNDENMLSEIHRASLNYIKSNDRL